MQSRKMKGFALADVPNTIMYLVLGAIVLGSGLVVLNGFLGSLTAGSVASNAVNSTMLAIDDFATWFPTWVVIIAAVVILGMLSYFKLK